MEVTRIVILGKLSHWVVEKLFGAKGGHEESVGEDRGKGGLGEGEEEQAEGV